MLGQQLVSTIEADGLHGTRLYDLATGQTLYTVSTIRIGDVLETVVFTEYPVPRGTRESHCVNRTRKAWSALAAHVSTVEALAAYGARP